MGLHIFWIAKCLNSVWNSEFASTPNNRRLPQSPLSVVGWRRDSEEPTPNVDITAHPELILRSKSGPPEAQSRWRLTWKCWFGVDSSRLPTEANETFSILIHDTHILAQPNDSIVGTHKSRIHSWLEYYLHPFLWPPTFSQILLWQDMWMYLPMWLFAPPVKHGISRGNDWEMWSMAFDRPQQEFFKMF